MKKLIISILFVAVAFSAIAQNQYESVLNQIEVNSTSLKALREQMEAQKIGNRTGIFLSNPEVEFGYLWGSPSAIGKRTDIKVTQEFDFPTVYSHKSNLSKLQNANVELAYKAERINLLLSAKQVCIELIYYNALAKEYTERLKNAEQIALTYQKRLEKGDVNAIECNKAQINLTDVQNEVARIETERNVLLLDLRRMNGHKDIEFSQQYYPISSLPDSFEDWYSQAESKSPMLQYVSKQIEISKQEIKVNKAMGLPKFKAGYMSEKVLGEQFQGFTVGVSIPLWENKNKVKQAKAQMIANESLLVDSKLQFHCRLEDLYLKASNRKSSVIKYREALGKFSNESLLKKALDAGEISLLNYLLEVEYFYNAVNKALEAERDLELAKAELSAVEL